MSCDAFTDGTTTNSKLLAVICKDSHEASRWLSLGHECSKPRVDAYRGRHPCCSGGCPLGMLSTSSASFCSLGCLWVFSGETPSVQFVCIPEAAVSVGAVSRCKGSSNPYSCTQLFEQQPEPVMFVMLLVWPLDEQQFRMASAIWTQYYCKTLVGMSLGCNMQLLCPYAAGHCHELERNGLQTNILCCVCDILCTLRTH